MINKDCYIVELVNAALATVPRFDVVEQYNDKAKAAPGRVLVYTNIIDNQYSNADTERGFVDWQRQQMVVGVFCSFATGIHAKGDAIKLYGGVVEDVTRVMYSLAQSLPVGDSSVTADVAVTSIAPLRNTGFVDDGGSTYKVMNEFLIKYIVNYK